MAAIVQTIRRQWLVRTVSWARYGLLLTSLVVLWVLAFSLVAYGFEGNWPCGLESTEFWFARGCGVPALTRPIFAYGGVSALWPSGAGALMSVAVLWVSPKTGWRLPVGLLGLCCALIAWLWMHLWANVPMSWATAALTIAALALVLVAVESRISVTSARSMRGLMVTILVILMTAGSVSLQSKKYLPDLIDHQVMARQSANSVIGSARYSRGPALAKFTFVIFFDPTCPWTLRAYREAVQLVATHPDVRLVVRPASFVGYYAAPRRYVEKLLSLDGASSFWKEIDALAEVEEAGGRRLIDHVRTSVSAADDVVKESAEARQSREFAERIGARATPLIFVAGPGGAVQLVKRTTNLAFYIR